MTGMCPRFRCVLIACFAASAACAGEDKPDEAAHADMLALDPTQSWEGRSLEEWAVEYMRWYYSATDCQDLPTDDPDGSWCSKYQDPDSPVFFFERSAFSRGTPDIVERTHCEVPAGKAIFVPVAVFFGDNAGMEQPLSEEELTSKLSDAKDSMRELVLKADDQSVARLSERGLGPLRFSYHVPNAPNRYGCDNAKMLADTEVDPSFLAGYFTLFAPPSAGRHEIEYSSVLTFFDYDFAFHVRSKFNVVE